MINIKGWEISSIEAKRFSKIGERMPNVRIDHNSTVLSVQPVNETDVSIDFRFTVNYTSMGYIRLDGRIIVADDEGQPEKISTEWTHTNNLPVDIANVVHSAVISNCITIATILSRDIQMPPPLPLPQIDLSQKKGQSEKGMEVA